MVQGRWEEIVAAALEKKRTLAALVSLTFDAEPLIRWRAVEALGLAADAVAGDDPEYVRSHLRRLYWLLSEESGGVERQMPIITTNPTAGSC